MTPHQPTNEGIIRFEIPNFERLNKIQYKEEPSFGTNYWTLSAHTTVTDDEKYLGVRLKCNYEFFSNLWACQATIRFKLLNENPENAVTLDMSRRFCRDDREIRIDQFKNFYEIASRDNRFVSDGKVVLEVSIKVTSNVGSNIIVLEKFDEPKEHLTDVVLLVEGKKVYVGKQILATHSKFFHSLFFSNFNERSQDEIELQGVKHSELIDLLNMVYPSSEIVDEHNVHHILCLADRFEMKFVIERVEKFLRNSPAISVIDKLAWAEKYNLAMLQFDTVATLKTKDQLADTVNHPKFSDVGGRTATLMLQKLARMIRKERPRPADEPTDSEEDA